MWLPLVTAALIAQSLSPQAPSLTVAVTPRVEEFRYRFDHPSSFNTTALVPHFFEQRYDVVPTWLSTEARYRIGGLSAASAVHVSLRARTRGSDIDTFQQPSGDVVTSGTDGDVMLWSWNVTQQIAVGEARGWALSITAGYRRDRAEFLPDDRIVTHTVPASMTRTFITDRETTTSQRLAFGLGMERTLAVGNEWTATFGAAAQPVVRAQLVIQLPDKYPGVDLRYTALGAGASAFCTLTRRVGQWHTGVTVNGGGVWAYRSTAAYELRSLSVSVFVGPGRR